MHIVSTFSQVRKLGRTDVFMFPDVPERANHLAVLISPNHAFYETMK